MQLGSLKNFEFLFVDSCFPDPLLEERTPVLFSLRTAAQPVLCTLLQAASAETKTTPKLAAKHDCITAINQSMHEV